MTEKLLTDRFDKNFAEIKGKIAAAAEKSGRRAEDIIILAATKTVDADFINYAIQNGIDYIGENRVQEFLSKENDVRKDVHKHFIGHLQTNKVRDIVGKVELIQSVHSLKLAREIGKVSVKKGIVTDVLVEVNIGNEESKSGFSADEVLSAIEQMTEIEGICVKGLMTIPPICDQSDQVRKYFDKMYKLFIEIRDKKLYNNIEILSMGMSDDYDVAVECGANMVRIGTALFGARNYNL
ncbi:MAG: YggS family pyridoxal phosphate-dependent enzyme [Acutalibacteraceae bacterium]|nr:YggS family pyridoxal phosphate-dependent enzyme [Acutalibacteraceae bacterium]